MRPLFVGTIAVTVAVGLVVVAVFVGSADMEAARVWRALVDGPGAAGRDPAHTIVWQLRLPRALLALAVGGGLSVVGVAMQALVRNPLAEPYLLGVSAGASAGASLLYLGFLPVALAATVTLPLAAAAGALLAVAVVFAAAQTRGGLSTTRLLLAGVAVASLAGAVATFATFATPDADRMRTVMFWLLGSLGGTRWSDVALPWIAAATGAGVLFFLARPLDAFLLGEDAASSLGIPVERLKRWLVAVTALVTGVLVAAAGAVGFVGLVVPHVVRFMVGAPHRRVVPLAFTIGGSFLLSADLAAQALLAGRELPLGIVTAAAGAPFFLWLLRRTERLEA